MSGYSKVVLGFWGFWLGLGILGGGLGPLVDLVWMIVKLTFWPLVAILVILAVMNARRRR
jgi:hypothetical protein